MAKSKQQKQQEAIARNRSAFPNEIKMWCRTQSSGELYKERLQISKEAAQKCASDGDIQLLRAAKEAHVDRYGNPLP